jgi:hypothetical protein
MSKGLGKGVGIPVKLLHESEGHVVTVRARGFDSMWFRVGCRFEAFARRVRDVFRRVLTDDVILRDAD